MLSFEPNVVVIDDKKEEIQGIVENYALNGVGCKFFDTDFVTGDDMPMVPYSDLNLVFLDLYFSDGRFDAELCYNWVQSIIPEKSFYVLIIWSKDVARTEEVLNQLQRNNMQPFLVLEKNKNDFRIADSKKYDYNSLFEEIEEELQDTPTLSEIGIWKKSVKNASNRVIGGLTKDHNPDVFKTKLQKIITSYGGTATIENRDNEHKRSILFDALSQVLVSNVNGKLLRREIDEINTTKLYTLPNNLKATIDRELNSWFHFKLHETGTGNLVPGLICSFKDNMWMKLYSIKDDERIQKLLSRQKGVDVKISSIAVLLTRPCDIAQKKFGNNLKLLSGLKISNPIRKDNQKNEFQKGDNKSDSVLIYDHLYFSEEENDVTLLFDFRYAFSVPENIFNEEFDELRVFNKELLSEIQVEYGSYSSRLGITQII